jgi:hypothetical protein
MAATLKMKIEFKNFLEQNGAFNSYVINLKNNLESSNFKNYKEILINILNEYDSYSFKFFMQSSFIWRDTPEGYNYWSRLCEKYYLNGNS